jgi:nitrite reductase/ring-hydroxylating ferredoxin subunit
MPRIVTAGKEGSLGVGRSKKVFVGDRRIAVFNDRGILRAVDDACTHVGGPLSEGSCENGVVTCPWHGARYRLEDGEGLGSPAYRRLQTYPVRIVHGMIQVEVADDPDGYREK